MQSEASIFQRASEEIKKIVESKSTDKTSENKETEEVSKENTAEDSVDSILRARLQNKVRTGEITPFQAAKQESDTKKNLG